MAHDDLDLVGGKEAAWTAVITMPKGEVHARCRDKVRKIFLTGFAAPSEEAVGIESLRVLVYLGTHHRYMRVNHELVAGLQL